MPRIRTIKPDFFTSESVSALPFEARLTFIGLWTFADDEGRCVDNVKLIRAALWPLDDRTLGDIEKDVDELVTHGMVARYTVGGRNYLHIPGMRTHQRINRPTPSKLPAPTTGGHAMNGHAPLNETGVRTHASITEDSPPERKGRELGKELGTNPPRTRAGEEPPEDDFPPEPQKSTDDEPDGPPRRRPTEDRPSPFLKPKFKLPFGED